MATSLLSRFRSIFAVSGPSLIDGIELQRLINYLFSSSNGITAAAGGGQANAVRLPSSLNEISVVATANDSVMLPAAVVGLRVYVNNVSANSLQVFGTPVGDGGNADTIAPHGSGTQAGTAVGVAQAGGIGAWYVCTTPNQWKQSVSA